MEPYTKENTASRYSDTSERPSIVEVIERYVPLRKTGQNHLGLCPFHVEKTPSFSVNEDKGVYFCHGCGEGGDVIRFIEKIEGVDFKGALLHLGMTPEKISSHEVTQRMALKAARDALTAWANETSIAIGARMREAGNHAAIAGKILQELPGADENLLRGEIEACEREWSLLETLQDDLVGEYTLDCWRSREAVENIAGVEA